MQDDFNRNEEKRTESFSFNDNYIYDVPHPAEAKRPEQEQPVYRPKKKENTRLKDIFEWLDVVIASIIAVVIIFTFIFRVVAIDGESMMNTLLDGERVIISDMFYKPTRGDIVVISRNTDNSPDAAAYEKPIIKRIIATEGELVDINFETGAVSVDGVVLDEPYIREPTHKSLDITFPVRVKENCVFVMGDNRNDSLDSRSSLIGENGMINEKYILGHAILRVFPVKKFGGLD